MFFSKQKSYLGVDIGAHGIKIVELKQEKNRPVLFTYGSSSQKKDIHSLLSFQKEKSIDDLLKTRDTRTRETAVKEILNVEDPREIALYAAELKAVCKACQISSVLATASLPISSVFHTVVNLPMLEKKDFDITLRAEIKKLLPMPIEEMVLDYKVIKNGGRFQRVIVSAVNRKLVTFYTQVFSKAGLTLEALEPESTALARSLVGKDNAINMVIDMGAERTNFFIIDQGSPITHHSLLLGGNKIDILLTKNSGLSTEDIGQVKDDLYRYTNSAGKNSLEKEKFLALLNPVLDPIIKQIEYGFDVYLRQIGNEEKRPEKIILTGGAATIPFLAQFLADKFKVRCFLGDPWARVVYQDSLKPVLKEIGPRMGVSIGLAMRKIL